MRGTSIDHARRWRLEVAVVGRVRARGHARPSPGDRRRLSDPSRASATPDRLPEPVPRRGHDRRVDLVDGDAIVDGLRRRAADRLAPSAPQAHALAIDGDARRRVASSGCVDAPRSRLRSSPARSCRRARATRSTPPRSARPRPWTSAASLRHADLARRGRRRPSLGSRAATSHRPSRYDARLAAGSSIARCTTSSRDRNSPASRARSTAERAADRRRRAASSAG